MSRFLGNTVGDVISYYYGNFRKHKCINDGNIVERQNLSNAFTIGTTIKAYITPEVKKSLKKSYTLHGHFLLCPRFHTSCSHCPSICLFPVIILFQSLSHSSLIPLYWNECGLKKNEVD
jgi:hypothetical protein